MRTLVQSLPRLSGDIPQLGWDGTVQYCLNCMDHRYKRLDYQYDLPSGTVLEVEPIGIIELLDGAQLVAVKGRAEAMAAIRKWLVP